MQNSRNPLVEPRQGDVVEMTPSWTRTVTGFADELVGYDAVNESGRFDGCVKHIEAWRKETGKARVVRRGEDA